MERHIKLEKLIRDSKLFSINFQFPLYSNTVSLDGYIIIEFNMLDGSFLKIHLYKPTKFDFFDDECNGDYIGHIKCFKNQNGYIISLDPEDERVDDIVEQDNMIIQFEDYEIIEN